MSAPDRTAMLDRVHPGLSMPSPFYTVAKSRVIWTVTRTGG